jgi:hypothetical protein
MTELEKVLIERDELTSSEAHQKLLELKRMVQAGHNPEQVLMEEVGLEPDYIFDILF